MADSKAQTRGTVESTACPWCKQPNDFREVEDYGLESGNTFKCDHCHRSYEVVRLKPVTMVYIAWPWSHA